MKFIKSIFSTINEFFQRYFVAIAFIVGVLLLIYSETNKNYKQVCHTIGSIILTSGIFAGIAKSSQFTEIYKKIIRDIIYSQEHLEVRKDLEDMWEKVTQSLSKQKFSTISDAIRTNIKKYFLPVDHDYYYDNFNIEMNIEFLDESKEYILVSEFVSYTIVCDDEELKIDNKFKCGIKIDLANKEKTTHNLNKLSINNEIYDNPTNSHIESNYLWTNYENVLKGKKSYLIKREETKQYNLNYNNIRKHLAMWIYNDLTIDITYPNDLYIEFHDMGVLNSFSIEKKNSKAFKRFKAEYKGLIYKNQGFFLELRKK
ncbi:hypothetical protein [Flavobacterium sp.]|uniref:hypothetical protein n=1 Tax=Flavobacterium sp. TaxID=239 RepID=UPI00374FE163